jgi:hypothetical protein
LRAELGEQKRQGQVLRDRHGSIIQALAEPRGRSNKHACGSKSISTDLHQNIAWSLHNLSPFLT